VIIKDANLPILGNVEPYCILPIEPALPPVPVCVPVTCQTLACSEGSKHKLSCFHNHDFPSRCDFFEYFLLGSWGSL
jgi:hypothetical protein